MSGMTRESRSPDPRSSTVWQQERCADAADVRKIRTIAPELCAGRRRRGGCGRVVVWEKAFLLNDDA